MVGRCKGVNEKTSPWAFEEPKMSRKREREEESEIKEPRKKAKKQNDAKGTNEQAALPIAALSPLFEIPELVENILKYLIMKPATIFNIAIVSKR